MPDFLPYPKIPDYKLRPELAGIFCYVFGFYEPGMSILIKREKDDVGIIVGDAFGNKWDRNKVPSDILGLTCNKMVEIMRLIRIPQMQLYYNTNNELVDCRISANRFLGPGMLRDIFAKSTSVQRNIKLMLLTPEEIIKLPKANKYIVKPSRYRNAVDDNPLYAVMSN